MKLIKSLWFFAMALVAYMPMSAKDETPSYNFSRGADEMQNGNTQAALEYFNKEVADNPKNGHAYLLIATLHMGNSEYGEALRATEAALKYLPKKDKESVSEAALLRGNIRAVEGDTVAAYSDIDIAIKQNPSNEDAYNRRGQLLYEQHKYDQSDAYYQKLAEINPGGVLGRMGLGRNAFARKDYGGAIEQYTRIITLYPEYSAGYSFRAEAYLGQKNYLKAIDDICNALEIDSDKKAFYLLFEFPSDQFSLVTTKLKGLSAKNPNTGEYDFYTGLIYSKNRMFAEANEAMERAFDKDAHYSLLEQIADNYSELGDYAKALEYIERASSMNPDDDDLLSKRADILGESGDIDGAIAAWGEYITKHPDFFGGYYRRGFFEDNSGRTEDALKDYNMAIMLEPEYAYAYLGKGDMLERLGKHEEAMEAYRKVVELDTVPNSESCAMYALLALNRRDEAVAFMDKVIANDSIAPGNYYDAACFSSRIGDTRKALYYLRTAFEKGFRRFSHVRMDDDLEAARALPEFEALMSEYEGKQLSSRPVESTGNTNDSMRDTVEIPFTPSGGVAKVSCAINELPLHFIFDTGASVVSLSMLEANFMMKNGYLKPSDVVGTGKFSDATGSISEGTIVNLREIDFGGLKLNNVKASVVNNQSAPLLLGQSVLGRLGKIEIDNQNKKLIIKPN